MQRAKTIVLLVGVIALAANIATFAQQHDHAEHQNPSSGSPSADDDVAIFCPTMKTGQLCSHGTSNVLQLTGEKQQKWIAFAQKYNRAVNAATMQLFKDSEGLLTPKEQELLKAWFAVGLNPEINELLYSKGLGPQKK
jgi:hypothetical protein